MERVLAKMEAFNVTEFHADIDFSADSCNVAMNVLFDYFPHSDPDNHTVLVNAKSSAESSDEAHLDYSCQFAAIFSYSEKPDSLGAWVKEECLPIMQQKAEEIFAAFIAALQKNVERS